MRFIYSTLVVLVNALMPLAGLFSAKAKRWVNGRRNWRNRLATWRKNHSGDLIWFHCASLGEFEQGRPVIERLRKEFPQYRILLTFFSPSGYEMRKQYDRVDGVFYLPADTRSNACDFLEIVQPKKVCFVKYEYWPNYMFGCEERGIPLVMISAILRPDQRFFGWSSFFWKPVLLTVDYFFVQDYRSVELLAKLGISCCTLAGDTRFDRVLEVVSSAPSIPMLEAWKGSDSVLIGGSTWPADEDVLLAWWRNRSREAQHWKLILVPHEIDPAHVASLRRMWPEAVVWSERAWKDAPVLIVNEIGHLSTLYRFANLAWIGGGFGAGIHNTLEAAAWRLPIVFGPRYEKFNEARGLLAAGAARSAKNASEGLEILREWTESGIDLKGAGGAAGDFVADGAGATDKIMSFLELR